MTRRIRHPFLLFGLLGLFFLSPPPAAARRASRGRAEQRAFREHLAEGKKHFVAQRYIEAIATFKKAFAIRPHRAIQVNIALAYSRLGSYVEALQHVRIYQKMRKPTDPALPQELQLLPLRVGRVVVRVPDPKAFVFVDGQFRARGGLSFESEPGRRVVDVRIGDRVVATRVFEVKGGQEQVWQITPGSLEPPRPRPRPRVRPQVRPPPEQRAVPGPPATARSAPTDRSGARRIHWAWFTTAAVVTAGALGAAVFTSVRNGQIHDDFLKDRTNQDLQQEGLTYQRAANALWGVAAAAGTAAILLAIFTRWRWSERPQKVVVTPLLGPGSVGLGLTIRR